MEAYEFYPRDNYRRVDLIDILPEETQKESPMSRL
jgi:hypothetical protein